MSVFTQAVGKTSKEGKTKQTQQSWNNLQAHAHDNHPRSQANLVRKFKAPTRFLNELEFEQQTCVILHIGSTTTCVILPLKCEFIEESSNIRAI